MLLILAMIVSANRGLGQKPFSIGNEMTFFKSGRYQIGNNYGPAIERPRHEVRIQSFNIDHNLVTVSEFAEFVKQTGYRTEAEKFGTAGVFSIQNGTWNLVAGACWHYPEGPQNGAAQPNHPVTQVSWNDAQAYCRWKKKRLPTSAEWEVAATSGGRSVKYAWGNYFNQNANVWTGTFPDTNTASDGYLTTSPVGHFGRNLAGLADMGGNVWQWCADDFKPYPGYTGEFSTEAGSKVLKGGSFLCDSTVCHGYRVTARTDNTPETALMHVGFRCACNATESKKPAK